MLILWLTAIIPYPNIGHIRHMPLTRLITKLGENNVLGLCKS